MAGHYTHTMLDKIYSFCLAVTDEKLKEIIDLSMTCITLLNQHTSQNNHHIQFFFWWFLPFCVVMIMILKIKDMMHMHRIFFLSFFLGGDYY